MLHVQNVAFVCGPNETAFDDVFASVAISVEIISGELAMCNPLEQDKISIFGIFKLVVNSSPWETAGLAREQGASLGWMDRLWLSHLIANYIVHW